MLINLMFIQHLIGSAELKFTMSFIYKTETTHWDIMFKGESVMTERIKMNKSVK